ncbi:Vacuolar protein sorting-associated protein isoform 2 [Schistosoma japonicum]|uniref:Vacuolar protein sorting-associated protein isoform 2 n=1 Tax=Schistosoma japonicum TaxID=6182 RepID=A0A4Z2CNY4_SCHJA|nr:Vacuolar protein sorting-associated protein isoform 2 [Schistosoma japonicum]
MFKKFLATLTDHIIGKYFENFNSESLSYGLLNGNITLSNLNLKKDTLNSLFGIPLTLRSGSVGNVSIFIPYTHLWSQAWQLSLENVNLVAYASADDLWDNLNRSPLADSPNISSVSRNQSEKCVAKIIPENQKNECSCEPSVIGKYSLDQMEKRWYQTITGGKLKDAADMAALVAMDSRSDNSSWWSYISSVGYNIIRSLQIEIRHVSLSLIDQNTPENQDPFNNLSCDYCSNFGTFTISLEHLTLETTNSRWERTTSTSHEPVEYKLISVYGLNITWSPKLYVPVKMTNYPVVTEQSSNESDTNLNENLLHILPPCHLTGHLKRNQINNGTINSESTTPSTTMSSCQSEFSNKAQIELHICLSQLDIQISQEFCHNILQLSEVLTSQYERLKQLKRRPSNVVRGSGQWWRYAAGEIRPQLRILFHSTLGHTSLSELALEAKSSVNYVKAYTVYLIQGLLPSSDVSKSTTKCLITTEQLHDICTNLKYTSELHLERLKHDQLWPVQRIAILRLIAMRRAGILLVKLLKSDSKGSVLITNDPEMPNSTGNDNPLATNQSWYYNWWRFSSWWGINSFLPSLSSSSVAVNELQSNVEKLNEPVTDQQTIDSELNHSMADTIFELLDEFAAHTNNIDYACITYPIFVQFVCIVDGCSLKLIDHQGSVEMHTQSAFVNISGQQMYFILEIRPQCNSYRLSTYIQSFTVQDERYMLKNCTHSSSTQSIPIFPVVVFPYYGGKSSSISKRLCSDVVPDLDRRVFSLTYEVNPAQKNVDFILSIHTEPLQVVFQPELIRQIMNFIHVASSAAPLHVETSTRRRFTSFKECTSKHSYSSSFKDTSNNTDVDFVNRLKEDKISNSSKLSQLIPSRVSTSMKPNNRWAIHFDITTLRVLFPNIFIQNNNNNQQPFTSNSVTCLLCDFSHLQMTNWPEIHTTSNVNKVDNVNKAYHVYTNPSQTLQQPSDAKDFDNDDDEQDEFKTPCSTPAELSEIEDNVEEEEENVKHEVEKSSQRKNQIIVTDERDFNTKSTELLTNDNNTDIYASYMITVENIRVLTGCLNLLHKLDLWSCYNVVTDDKLIESKSEETTFKFDNDTFSFNDNSILRVSKSTIISRLCLVDPFNLTLLISRRISYPVHDFTPNLNHVSSDSIPPFIWMTLKQESCVLRLSNKKISDLLSCLNACQRQLNGIQPMKQRYSMMMKRYARSRTQTVSCSYSSVHSSRNAFKHRSYHTSISSPHCSCHSLSGTCCSEQPVDFCRLTVFNFKRKQLIGTYSIQSFSIQFESKDRLLAECRFDEAMFNVSVYRGSPIAYCVRFKLGSISMVDAVSNLGGVYDVIVNSNEKVKRTDSPNLTVTSYNEVNTDSTHIINGDSSLWTNSFIPLSDHICPEKEFSINESCNFLTGYLNWCPTSDCSNCLSHNNLLRMGGTCFIQLNIRLLNITGYPITIMAINRFLNDLYTSSKLSGESYPDNTGEYHLNNSNNFVSTTYRSSSSWVKYNLKLSIDHFKLLMLNKINSSQPDEHKYRNLELSVKRVAEIIFSGLHVNLNHSSSLDSLSLKLRYFQIIPLCNPKFPIGQYLLGPAFSLSTVDGHCPCSNLITLKITAGSVTTTNDFQRKLRKRIQLIVSNIVYVHFVHEFHEIITWFIQLIPLFKGVHSTVGNDQCFIMDNHHSLKQNQEGFFATWPEFLITFINPLILIPCNTNSRSDQFNQFLLMGTKFIKINYYPLYCNRLLSNSSTVIIHQEINNSYSVQLCFMHFGVFLYVNVDADENDNKKPSGNSYSSTACGYFLNLSDIHKFWLQVSKLDDIMSTRIRKTQSSRHHVIVAPTDFSFCVTYVKCDLSRYPSIPIPELQSFRFNISDLAMMHSMINNTDITSDDANKSNPPYPYSPILSSTSSVSNMNLLLFTEPINSQLIVEAYIHSVQINLTKMNWNFLNVVVHELIKEYYDYYAVSCSNTESIQPNNTDVLSQLPYMEHSVMLPTTDYHSVKSTHSMEFGLFIKCTQILVIILADLDIIPISLASLTFDSFSFSSSIHIYSNGITMPSCIHITLNGVDLQNQLIKSNYVEDNNINDKRQQFLLTSTRTSLKRKRSTSFNHNDISPISLRIIILSDEHQTFCQTKYFGKFIFDTINVQLSFEPWILLLDFFDLCDYKEEISQMTVPESHHDVFHRFDSHSSISSNDPIVAFLLDIGSMHCFVNDSNQEKDEEVDDKSRNIPHHISNIESNLALLSFIGMKAHINYFLIDVTDRRFSSPSFNLPIDYSYLEIKGQMYDIQLHALQEKHAYLYPTRLITAPTMSHAVDTIKNFDNSQSSGVVFQFIKPAKHLYKSLSSDSTSDVDNDQDIYLSVQMPSVTYIHTQSFLTSFIDSLMNFSEHYDFLRQTRGAVKGFQIPLVPPPSSRVRIHIYGGPLNLILPVDSHSSNVLIANIDHLKLYNTFLRNIANQEDVNNESKFIKSKANEKCDDRYFFSAIRSTSKNNLLGLLECSNLNSEDANDSHPTLIDRMTMEFHGFSLYCAEQVNDNLTQKSDGKHIGIHLPNQSFIPIGGSNYSSSCPNNAKLLFNPIDCISLFLEHNLTSDKVHKIPDWKLIGEFANCQVHLDLYTYCLILGVLSRNIGEISESYFVDTSKPFPESNIWSKFTVDIRLKSVQATLFDYLKSSIAIVNNPITIASMNDFLINESCQFAIIDFCDALFTFEYFSNQSTTIQLQCFDINLIRIPGDTDKEQGQFILKSFTTTTSSSTQSALHEETQHEDKALKTPKLFIFSNSSSLHSTFLFSSTRLHLMFDLDWLLRFQRFIISSPMSSYTGNSQTVYTSQSNLLSSGTDRTTVDAYTTRTISKLNLYSDDLIYNHSRTSISPSIPDTYLHIWIDDCEVCMPYENSCFLIKSSARLSRHARKFSSFGKIYDEIYADILQFRIYHHLQSLLIIPNSMKFHYKLYHTSMGKSPSSSQLSSSLSTTTGTFMNTGLPSDIIKWSTGVFFELPHRQRNFLHPSQMQLQLQASLTAPSIHITSNYSDIQIALHFISFLMLTKSSSANVQSNNNVDTHSSMRNACDRSLLSTFWPNIFADYISKQLINFNISIALSICLFDRNSSSFQSSLSSEEIPLIKVCVESMKFFWKRSSLQASLECNGISCSYYNQNLIAWEPVLEPWSCSINWSEKFEQDFSKNISFSCSSQYCLKLNMTVPLVQLIRRLLNTMIVKVSQTDTNESTTTNELASNQQDFSLLSTQNTGSFILVNKTGTSIRYKLVNNNSMESLLKPQILIPDILDDDFTNDNNDKSNDLAPDSHAYLPIKISSFAYNSSMVTNKYESNVDSIQLPCLLVQVAGWKPIYPIALDRLGTYHRVIERLENAEPIILKNEQNECWKYHLPIFNRLVIDIVRDHNVHYVIYLRSGLTITNDLNQSINIGLEIFPPKSSELLLNQSSSDDNDDVDYLTNTLNGSIIFLTVCKPRCTYPVSINHVGLMSLGLGNLCFSPVKTVMNRQNLSSFFINNISDQSKLFTSNLSDWCIVYYHQNNETITEEEQSKSPPHSSLISTSSTSSSFVDFVEKRKIASSTRMIDWTSLKQSNELLEAVLISTCQLPTSSLTMHNVNSLHRFQQNPTNLLPSLNKSSTSNNLNNNSKFHICVTVVRDQFPLDPQWSKLYSNQWYSNYKLLLPITIPGHHITIGPVLRITNLLPCDMMYYFAKTEISGILGSKEEACVYNLFPVTTINFGIHLDGFPKCDTLSIPTNTYNQKVLIRLYDTLNRPLELQVHVCSRAFGARHLTISPVICLLNKSGLPLIFAQSSSLSSNQFGLSSLASSSQTSILAAGQTEEHEQACVLMPLLFSFANKSEGYLLRVRIGKFYHSVNDVIPTNENDKFHTNNMKHCTWSPGISLDKRGVDVLQLKVYTDNNRLSSMLYLGFEVHTEQDANNSLTTSTIVTFRPRYIIENLTQYQLNITQRYCLKSVNNFPGKFI